MTLSKDGKKQLRCFLCRQACPIRDGDWQDHKNQQVFLCKACKRSQEEHRQTESALMKAQALTL